MAINFACRCGQKLQAPDHQAGQHLVCPRCHAPVTVPGVPTQASPPPVQSQGGPPPLPSGAGLSAGVTRYPTPAPTSAPPMYGAQRSQTCGLATASLAMGILGCLIGITSILAVIFGHCAISRIKRSGGRMQGLAMAGGGLALGYSTIISTIFWIIIILILVEERVLRL